MDGREIRCGDELIPDALGLIFTKLSLEEKLTVIPGVCKSWRKAVMGPYCWQEIDILKWSSFHLPPEEKLERMLQMLISRSSGSPWKLCVPDLPNDIKFSFIADHAGSLQNLQLPGSKISDSIVEQVAGRMSAITVLDLSECDEIGARALEAFGKNCKLLVDLRRNMYQTTVNKISQDDEAHAIATTMPKLKHLEIGFTLITTEGILDIISGCQDLESLDVCGCLYVKRDEKFLYEKCSRLEVLGLYYYDSDCSEDWTVYSHSSGGYSEWSKLSYDPRLYIDESSDGVSDDEEP